MKIHANALRIHRAADRMGENENAPRFQWFYRIRIDSLHRSGRGNAATEGQVTWHSARITHAVGTSLEIVLILRAVLRAWNAARNFHETPLVPYVNHVCAGWRAKNRKVPMRKIINFLRDLSWPLAWSAAKRLSSLLGVLALVAWFGSLHYLLVAPSILFLLACWFLLYKIEYGVRVRRTFGREI